MDDRQLETVVLQARIVVAAMCLGCLGFLAFTFFQRPPGDESLIADVENGLPILTIVALMLLPSLVIARFVVIAAQDAAARRAATEDDNTLLQPFTARLITGAALLEGGALFATVAYMVEGGLVTILVALVAIGCVALHFPSAAGLGGWIDRIQRTARDEAELH